MKSSASLPVIILGAGGHAKVVLECLRLNKREVLGLTSLEASSVGRGFEGISILGDDSVLNQYPAKKCELVIGIGSVGISTLRQNLYEKFKAQGYTFATVKHPSAYVSQSAVLQEGCQIMAGVIIQPGCSIGENAIINTRATIDHDCSIGAHSHVAPGCTLSGCVEVGNGALIGTGASVIQGIHIGNNSLIAAGAVVVRDVSHNGRVAGIPAKPIAICTKIETDGLTRL